MTRGPHFDEHLPRAREDVADGLCNESSSFVRRRSGLVGVTLDADSVVGIGISGEDVAEPCELFHGRRFDHRAVRAEQQR